ncbi:MAG: phosphoribosyltransferase family protein [bacterium]
MKKLENYASFKYSRLVMTDGRIILLDEKMSPEIKNEIQGLETLDGQELIFLDDMKLALDMEIILSEIIDQEQDILIVFPGNGSCYPRNLSAICSNATNVKVYASRFWQPGTDPVVTVGDILPDTFIITEVKTVVIVDDVISSGQTMQKICAKNSWKFPQAKWIGVSWVSQIPQQRAKSGIKGYEYIGTACVIGKNNGGRVPINSISTLRQQMSIAESYAKRQFKEPELFLDLISR